MAFKAWEECERDLLVFPINGREYTPPELPARLSEAILKGDNSPFVDDDRSLWEIVLGGTYAEMVADGVSGDAVARAGFTVLTDALHGADAAAAVWESGSAVSAIMDRYAQHVAAAAANAPAKKAAARR